MFTGFNLKIDRNNEIVRDIMEYKAIGEDIYEGIYASIRENLEYYVGVDGKIDGSKIQEDWFPEIKADIFLSHSHNDKDLAIALAGWLYKNFKVKVFIDSCVWGYSNDLLKKLDDKYNKIEGTNTYDYNARNYSTAHVHMMLSTALQKMIDKVECVFFLNTENSITKTVSKSSEEIVTSKTESPWIWSEIVTTNIIRKKKLSEYRKNKTNILLEKSAGQYNLSKPFIIEYDVTTSHLNDLNVKGLESWLNYYNEDIESKVSLYLKGMIYPLDYLYRQVDIPLKKAA